MMFDRAEYPSIRWEWRIFVKGSFIGYVEATCDEIYAAVSESFYGVIDRDYLSVDLI